MSRTADHAARRRQVATALVRVIASEGLDGTSLRRVAAEAGTSVGLIQRYFTTKDDLLQFAFDHLYEQTRARLDAVDPSGPIGEVVHRALATMLPLDAERAVENRTWIVFLAAAASNPRLARLARLVERRDVQLGSEAVEEPKRRGGGQQAGGGRDVGHADGGRQDLGQALGPVGPRSAPTPPGKGSRELARFAVRGERGNARPQRRHRLPRDHAAHGSLLKPLARQTEQPRNGTSIRYETSRPRLAIQINCLGCQIALRAVSTSRATSSMNHPR
jgi:AcrR family transcriptional regulator